MDSILTEFLPKTRCSASLRERLEAIAKKNAAKELSDHIRLAVERYVEQDGAPGEVLPTSVRNNLRDRGMEIMLLSDRQLTDNIAVIEALISHWDRTKKDYYGIAAGKAASAPLNNN
jgi:hypothetical protein